MPLKRKVYDVYLNPAEPPEPPADPFSTEGVTCHRVVVTHADQMRGELEANKRSLPMEAGQNVTSVILWCALVRTGVYTGRYEQFRNADCAGIESVEPEAAGEPAEVPPTPEPSDYGSSSPTTSPATPTGPTPTSTSA